MADPAPSSPCNAAPADELPAIKPSDADLTEAQKKYMQDLAKAAAESDPVKLEELIKRVGDVGVPEASIEFAKAVHRRLASQSAQAKAQERKKAKSKLRQMRKNARAKLQQAVEAKSKTALRSVSFSCTCGVVSSGM